MSKITLQFDNLPELTGFSKRLTTGFLLNTSNLTLTTTMSPQEVHVAEELFHARCVQTTDKVFSYDRHILSSSDDCR